MAASKDPNAYPAAYFMILQHFAGGRTEPVTEHYPRRETAEKTRFTFYNFKRALGKAQRVEDLTAANAIMVKVYHDPLKDMFAIEFSPRDNEPVAMGLEAALARAQAEEDLTNPVPSQVPSKPQSKPIDHMEAYMERLYGDVASKNGVQVGKGEEK